MIHWQWDSGGWTMIRLDVARCAGILHKLTQTGGLVGGIGEPVHSQFLHFLQTGLISCNRVNIHATNPVLTDVTRQVGGKLEECPPTLACFKTARILLWMSRIDSRNSVQNFFLQDYLDKYTADSSSCLSSAQFLVFHPRTSKSLSLLLLFNSLPSFFS